MNVQRQIDRLIAYQAAEWYETMKKADLRRHEEFVRWISESPRHMEAFLAISSEAPVLREVLATSEFDIKGLLSEVKNEAKVRSLPLPTPSIPSTVVSKRWRTLLALAAALALLAIGTPYALHLLEWQRFETPTGEQRTIQLKEGSLVTLNAQTHLEVRFSETQREISLPRGEATFTVARDASRPFRVRTPGAIVEAVGTSFNVYAHADGTTSVTVIEGKVKVSNTAVAAGQEAQVSSAGKIALQPDANVSEAIAWQQRKLVFRHTPLVQIAEEFNRYNKSVQIRLENVPAEAFSFSGAFNADDPQSLATLLMHEPDLAVEHRDGEIVIKLR